MTGSVDAKPLASGMAEGRSSPTSVSEVTSESSKDAMCSQDKEMASKSASLCADQC